MSPHDANKVQSAVSHWAPRLIANGVNPTDFEEIVSTLQSWNDWCPAFCNKAAVHEDLGREALARGETLSAGEHLQRAAAYYHFAKFLFVHDLAQMKAAHLKAVECRNRSLAFLSPPGERAAIPFENSTLYGILRKPVSAVRPPIMIMVCGLDSAKEETAAYEEPFLARGIATLVFDGPGQGEAEYDFPIRGNFETAVRAVCDFIETRDDVDAQRIGLWGVSLGGYYAPRAAAFETRVKACIALSGPFDFAALWDKLPELTREAFRVRSHAATLADARHVASTLSLTGVAGQIRCPLFIVAGGQDPLVPLADAERLAREAQGPVDLLRIEDGNHIANNRPYKWRLRTADWMAAKLGSASAPGLR